jgi:type IV secretion system protein VirB5
LAYERRSEHAKAKLTTRSTTMKINYLSAAMAAAIVAVAGLGASSPAKASGIPVIDVAKIANDTANQAANIAKYIQMVQQYQQQIAQMKQQYESLTGSRNLGEIMNNPALKDYLPSDWQNVYAKVQSGGYKGLSGSALAIRDANVLFDACANKTRADKQLCERSASKAAQDKAFAVGAFDKAKARWDQIAGLMKQINSTSDPKSIAELQARITAETAAVQNEQTKMQLFALASQAEDRLIQQQRHEANARTWGATGGGITAEPLTFGR